MIGARATGGLLLVALVLAVVLAGCAGQTTPTPRAATSEAPRPWPAIRLEPFLSGLDQPVDLVDPGDGSGRLFVVEQGGLILVAKDGKVQPTPFLDGTALTSAGGERGMFSIAFDPEYAHNGRAYVSYTDTNGDSVVARYHVRADDPDRLDPASAQQLFFLKQPYPNHNGGDIVFGPDGWLYLGFGDGGSGGDPEGNGQNKDALLASLLRLDVRGDTVGAPEIFAKGLRNPWRFSFDRATGDLWIGDVGQNKWEEIDYAKNGTGPGRNYGWNAFEGDHVYDPLTKPFSPVTGPVAEYSHDDGSCAVTGGFVYHGEAVPALRGIYVYGDYCSGKIWGLRSEHGGWNLTLLLDSNALISSFGEDARGELYVVDHRGGVDRIDA